MGLLTARIVLLAATIGLVWQQSAIQSWLLQFERLVPVLKPSSSSSSSSSSGGLVSNTDPYIFRRVVAVADLHGDLEHAHNVLRMAGLIDDKEVPSWTGGHSVLVSTGDIVDRGDDTIKLYQLFQRLRHQAAETGGAVWNCVSVDAAA
jgi:hypothetical protein